MINTILCLHEKHFMFDESKPKSTANLYIHSSLEAAGLAENVRVFYTDVQKKLGMHGMIRQLLQEVQHCRPDILVFLIPFEVSESLGQALQYIRNTYGTHIVAFASDLIAGLASPGIYAAYEYFGRLADVLISSDSACTRPLYHQKNNIQGHPTVDLGIFKPIPNVSKDIDVSFVGSMPAQLGIYDVRRQYIEYIKPKLEAKGYRFYVGGGQYEQLGDKSLSLDDYVAIMNRSKIVLNFSRTTGNLRHLKSRVIEAMACSSFVLTEECLDIGFFFEANKDYVAFGSSEDLLNKLFYYLANVQQRDEIALSAHWKVTNIYTPRNVWGYVFKQLGFPLKEIQNEQFMQYETIIEAAAAASTCPFPSMHTVQYIADTMARKDYPLATRLATARLIHVPFDANTWYNLGKCLHYLGQQTLANKAFARCRLLDPLSKRNYTFLSKKAAAELTDINLTDMNYILNPGNYSNITAVIVTQNNEKTIARCLASLQHAVDKIVLVDTCSQDRTIKIAERFLPDSNLTILTDNSGAFAQALLKGINQACTLESNWIFIVYPDEYLFEEDTTNIKLITNLYHEHNTFLNVLSKPILPDVSTDNPQEFSIESNRLFQLKNGIIIMNNKILAGSTGMPSQTIGIHLHYDLTEV